LWLAVLSVWLGGPLQTAQAQSHPETVDTAIVSVRLVDRRQVVELFGTAAGRLTGVELAVRRSDGWFWHADSADWQTEPAWAKGALMPVSSSRFVWHEKLVLPPLDGEKVSFSARALGEGAIDSKPAVAHLSVDNLAPAVNRFDVLGPRWISGRDAKLTLDVAGAESMRFAGSRRDLSRAGWRPYSSTARFRVSDGDGPKQIYGAFADAAGNTTVTRLTGGRIWLDTAPPAVNRLTPDRDTPAISDHGRIGVRFIEAGDIDMATVKNELGRDANFYLTAGGSWVPTALDYSSRGKTVSLIPLEPLVEGTLYSAHLKPGIKDLAGNRFDDEVSWSFRAVKSGPPVTRFIRFPPPVFSERAATLRGVAQGAGGVAGVDVLIRDETGRYWAADSKRSSGQPILNAADIEPGRKPTGVSWSLNWRPPGGESGRFTITAVAQDRFLTKDPKPPAVVVAVVHRRPAARAAAAKSEAEPVTDKPEPRVTSTFPRPGAQDVNVSVMLTAGLTGPPPEEAGVNPDTFKLLGPDGEPVEADVRYDRTARSAVLTPLEPLAYGSVYQAILSPELRDRLDQALEPDESWEFRTIDRSDHPPGRPIGLKVVSTHLGDRLTWDAPTEPDPGKDFNPPVQGGYNVYRADDKQGPFVLVNSVPLTANKYLDNEYQHPGRRYYSVRAVDAGGGVGPATPVRSNRDVDISVKLPAGKKHALEASNGSIVVHTGASKRPAELKLKTAGWPNASSSPLRRFEIDTSLSVSRVSLHIGGDPSGAVIVKSGQGDWQPLTDGLYQHDFEGQRLVFGPLRAGRFAVINRLDFVPPGQPRDVQLEPAQGRPVITWSTAADQQSGIRGYRLYRSEAQLTPAAELALGGELLFEELPESEQLSVIDFPASVSRFADNQARADRPYFYALAAVNGSGQVGRPVLVESAGGSPGDEPHQPRFAAAVNCLYCHRQTGGAASGRKPTVCRECHPQEGALTVVYDLNAGKTVACSRCHELPKAKLVKLKAGGEPCGGCHSKTLAAKKGDAPHAPVEWGGLACTSCHSLHRPGDGGAGYLIDPRNGRKTWTGETAEFCLACHGAAEPIEAVETIGRWVPRTVIPPGRPMSGSKKTTHRKSDDCSACHEPHPSSKQVKVVSQEAACYRCHRRSGAKGAARCGDCHNVHESDGSPRRAFSNRVSGILKGVRGVEPINAGPGTLPGFVEVASADREYQICLKCHSSYSPTLTLRSDLALLFNPQNLSHHPVQAPGRNKGLKAEAFAGGWSEKATMYCSDCHASRGPRGTAKAAHGSTEPDMTAADYGPSAPVAKRNDLCYRCHNRQAYDAGKAGSRFAGRGGHADHVAKEGLGCWNCHETHGSSFTEHLIKIEPIGDSGTTGYTHDESGGSCTTACHEQPDEPYQYSHEY
jgi:predicted CXXCH cytochrome family protein